jgi:hypothetical protein
MGGGSLNTLATPSLRGVLAERLTWPAKLNRVNSVYEIGAVLGRAVAPPDGGASSSFDSRARNGEQMQKRLALEDIHRIPRGWERGDQNDNPLATNGTKFGLPLTWYCDAHFGCAHAVSPQTDETELYPHEPVGFESRHESVQTFARFLHL